MICRALMTIPGFLWSLWAISCLLTGLRRVCRGCAIYRRCMFFFLINADLILYFPYSLTLQYANQFLLPALNLQSLAIGFCTACFGRWQHAGGGSRPCNDRSNALPWPTPHRAQSPGQEALGLRQKDSLQYAKSKARIALPIITCLPADLRTFRRSCIRLVHRCPLFDLLCSNIECKSVADRGSGFWTWLDWISHSVKAGFVGLWL